MKKVLVLVLTVAFIALTIALPAAQGSGGPALALSPAQTSKFKRVEKRVLNQYIVVLKDEVAKSSIASIASQLAQNHGGSVRFTYQNVLKGFAIQLPEAAAIALSQSPLVDYVQEDGVSTITETQPTPQVANTFWGLDRIDQRDQPLNGFYTYNTKGEGVHAYILDTGIWPTHNDFEGRASVFFDAFGGDGLDTSRTYHGTMVAGVVGGRTYGVAKSVLLHGVRVCRDTSPTETTCQDSEVTRGLDRVVTFGSRPAVVNMSLGDHVSPAIDAATQNTINAGVTCVVAAGNGNTFATNSSPARVQDAITVGAITTDTDNRANYSNYGSLVDLFAPGGETPHSFIPSTASGYTFGGGNDVTSGFTGTSAAAPHVTGVVAQYLGTNPGASPATVGAVINNNATVGRVIDPGPGSPNRLLYSNFLNDLAANKVATQSSTLATSDVSTVINQPGVSSYYTAGQAGSPTTIAVNRTGRYVRVQLAQFNYLSLAEVRVLSGATNLALGKPASQYNTGFGGTADRAVDGNTDGNWLNNSVTHTYNDYQNWWQVDLGSVQSIDNIEVWNRTDCCGDRLSNFYVFVSNVPFTGSTADKAVDGNTDGQYWNGSVSHTNLEYQPWWQVDLNGSQQINTIQVWNRTDCCGERLSNFYVFVSDVPFQSSDLTTTINQPGVSSYYTAGQGGRPTTLTINQPGQYVRVQLAGTDYLSLSEVQIW